MLELIQCIETVNATFMAMPDPTPLLEGLFPFCNIDRRYNFHERVLSKYFRYFTISKYSLNTKIFVELEKRDKISFKRNK